MANNYLTNDTSGQEMKFLRKLDADFEEVRKSVRFGLWKVINAMQLAAKRAIMSKARVATSNTNRKRTDIGTFGVPLVEGVRAFLWKNEDSATIHIYGNLGENDGTWRLRFFETGTSKRWAKLHRQDKRGNWVKTRVHSAKAGTRYLGQMHARPFFKSAVEGVNADSILQEAIANKINQINAA